MSQSLWTKVNKAYGIKIDKTTKIKKDKSSFVTKIISEDGTKYVLKSLFVDKQRQRFITDSEKLLIKEGFPLAKPIETKNQELHVMHNGYPYVLYQWVNGKRHPLNNVNDLRSMIQTIAKLHKNSTGLKYPKKTKIYKHKDWNKQYMGRKKEMDKFYNQYKDSKDSIKKEFARYVPFFRDVAKKTLNYLKKSKYSSLANRSAKQTCLIHGDAHQGNFLYEDQHVCMIDFEDVCFDFPSTDLNRIFAKYTRRHDFKGEIFDNMMKWYEEINPLSPETKRVVLIDCLFPHSFCRLFRLEKYKIYSLEETRHFLQQEKKKTNYILKHYF